MLVYYFQGIQNHHKSRQKATRTKSIERRGRQIMSGKIHNRLHISIFNR